MSGQPTTFGDIVQIDPEHDDVFGACFMTVTEVRPWGLIGYVRVPGKGDKGGNAYYRVPHGKYARVGAAEWMSEDHSDGITFATTHQVNVDGSTTRISDVKTAAPQDA